jgi:hypothetical protein
LAIGKGLRRHGLAVQRKRALTNVRKEVMCY